MNTARWWRAVAASATLGVLAACADQSEIISPTQDVAAAAEPEGALTICKAGNVPGTFGFAWAITYPDGSAYSSGTQSVAVGSCVQVAQVPTNSGTIRLRAAVTETSLPANWALTSISIAVGPPVPGGVVPVINLATRSASNAFIGNDVGATFTFTNTYTPPAGCTLTQGYWKTHNATFKGGAPVDATWALLGGAAEGTSFYLSGMTWFEVFWTAPGGNAYYNLAHQYMAAQLNMLRGASVPAAVQTAFNTATGLFNTYTPAQIGALSGNNSVRKNFLNQAGILGGYNEGLTGPGHCN